MKIMRKALLAAAVMAVVPAAAYADVQDQAGRSDHGDRGNHGNWGGGGDRARPTPPQAQRGSGMMVMSRGVPEAPRAAPPQQQVPQAQFRPEQRGGWQNGDRGQGGSGWRGRGDARGNPAQIPNNGDSAVNRGQRWGDNRRVGNDDGRRGDNRYHGQWNNQDRDRWNRGDPNAGQWNWGDRRWEGRRDAGDRWDGKRGVSGRPGGNDHRWDANRWRNDRRYDWRDWRGSHRHLFNRHYNGPRGYHYRSVYAGFFLEPLFYGSSYWLDDPYDYRLPPVSWPLRWVHYYNDALLVDITTGEVIDVIQNFFF